MHEQPFIFWNIRSACCIILFMKPRRTFNPKRQIRPLAEPGSDAYRRLEALAEKVRYEYSPEHKRNPGDFGSQQATAPRQGKSLCEEAGDFDLAIASGLLRDGIRAGLVSVQERNGWPQNVWAVASNGRPLESQLGNPAIGAYHGYPMPPSDPFAEEVVERWNNR